MLYLWTRTNYGLVIPSWWFITKEFGWQRILRKWNFIWKNKWNSECHNFRILRSYLVTSANGKQDCKNWDRCFSLTLFEVWYERNENFFFSYKKLPSEAAVRICSSKKLFLKISQYLQKNTCVEVSFNKVAGLKTCSFTKKRLQHWCFSCDYWAIFKNTFFTSHLCWLLLYTELVVSFLWEIREDIVSKAQRKVNMKH